MKIDGHEKLIDLGLFWHFLARETVKYEDHEIGGKNLKKKTF